VSAQFVVHSAEGEIKVRTRATVLAVVAVLAAVLAASAYAGGNSSTSATYGSRGTKIQRSVSKHTPTKRTTTPHIVPTGGGMLPFTGLDLAFIAGGGVLLVVMGVSLRRLTRKPPAA
jgi:hypothetical protein